jgi:signal peptidase II
MLARRRILAFAAVSLPLVIADFATKRLALAALQPARTPHEVVGDVVRLTLTFNRDAAMGLSLGPWSRWGFAALAALAVVVLVTVLVRSAGGSRWYPVALGLVCGGAAGNLIDRIRWDRGVVDFIDVGIGTYRFWTFNVADTSITVGATLLALILWREGRKSEPRVQSDSSLP